MILNFLLYLSALFPISLLYATINLDYHITSKINTTDMLYFNDNLLVSTSGGVYLIENNNFKDIELIDAVDILDLSEPDSNGYVWIASKKSGLIQVLNSSHDIIKVISYPVDIDAIFNVKHSLNKTFAIGCRGECQNTNSLNDDYFVIIYDDYYFDNIVNNFPVSVNSIRDIEIQQNSIYIATDSGLLSSSLENNLLLSSSWQLQYDSENIISLLNQIAITDNGFINFSNNTTYDYENILIQEEIIDLYDFYNDGRYHLLTDLNLYLLNSNFEIESNITEDKDSRILSDFSCAIYDNNSFYFGLHNNGIVNYNAINNLYTFYSPETLFQNKFTAITIKDDYLAGVSKSGGFILNNINSIQNKEILNYYPYAFSDTSLYHYVYPNNFGDYNSIILPYWSGGKNPKSTLIKNDYLFFANSGSYPFIDDNINYHYNPIFDEYFDGVLLPPIDYYGALGVLSINNDFLDIKMNSNGVFGGLGGLLDPSETSGYMTVGQIKSDKNNNIWVVNPFSENYFDSNQRVNRPLAFKIFNNLHWNHVYDYSLEYFIPTEIAFSQENRLWVGYKFYENNNSIYSKGGLRLLEYNNINDENDDVWYDVNSPDVYANISVWSLEITVDNTGKEVLWVLSDLGLRGYYFEIFDVNYNNKIVNLYPFNDTFYFSDLTIQENNKIKTDFNNNLWLVTINDGLRIIHNDGAVYPSQITKNNYNILSDNIYDVDFHENGDVYIATDMGISVLNTSFSSTYSPSSLSVSPNPFYINQNNEIIFSNIGPNTSIQLITLSGLVLKDFFSMYNGQSIKWNGTNNSGNLIPSGIYLLVSSNSKQNSSVTKIAIVR